MRTALLAVAALAVGCSGSSPTKPSPAPTPAPPPPAQVYLSGHVTATNGGQVLGGVQVTLNTTQTMSDGGGWYALLVSPGTSGGLALTGGGVVPRTVRVAVSNPHDFPIDVFGPGFDLAFYRAFARNGFEQPAALQPIRRWTQAPKIYLKTVDEAGQAIDPVTLDTVAAALIDTAGTWSGGVFGLAAMERGSDTREGVTGWLTVRFAGVSEAGICGRAQVGSDGGWLQFDAHQVGCAWRGSRVAPRSVRHELGHAFGYWHVPDPSDLMNGGSWTNGDQQPSPREQEYARYVYHRPVGNFDPDNDPVTAVQSFAVQRFVD